VEKRQWDSPTTLFAFEARERAEIPPTVKTAMHFVDCHVHLSDYPAAEQVVNLSASCGIELVAVSVDRLTSHKSLELARRNAGSVRPFVGVHPSEAGKAADMSWFGDALRRADGCGEVGLDPSYFEASPEKKQAEVLGAQLHEVEEAPKPVQVHARGAEASCLQQLTSYSLKGVLMHWFEDEGRARVVQDRGYFVSFGPALVYSRKLRRIAASFDRGLVLTESDGPVPFTALGGVEGPAMVPSVVFELARIWKTTFEEAQSVLSHNSSRYLGLPGKG
jgi:TatD DNase family protein